MPFLSIVIPVYNAEKYLDECFKSIQRQNFEDYEVILIDDGSKDQSPGICDNYAEKDARVHVLHIQNGGPSKARNLGFKTCKGDYIYCIDNDDYFEDDKYFESIYKSLRDDPVDILFTGATYVRDDTMSINKRVDYAEMPQADMDAPYRTVEWLISHKMYETSCWTKVINTKFLLDNELFFDDELLVEDLDWNMRFLQKVKRLNVLRSCSYTHVYRGGSITASWGERSYKSCLDQITTIGRWKSFYENFSGDRLLSSVLLSYLCYQFFITLGKSTTLEPEYKKEIKKSLRKIDGISKYAIEKKQKVLCFIYRVFGFKIASGVVGWYYSNMRTRAR